MNNFESLEYNKAENHLFWLKRKSKKKLRAWHWFMKWGTCLAIGNKITSKDTVSLYGLKLPVIAIFIRVLFLSCRYWKEKLCEVKIQTCLVTAVIIWHLII